MLWYLEVNRARGLPAVSHVEIGQSLIVSQVFLKSKTEQHVKQQPLPTWPKNKYGGTGAFCVWLPLQRFSKNRRGHKQWGSPHLSCDLARSVGAAKPAHRNSHQSASPQPIKALCTISHLGLLPSDIYLNLHFSELLQTFLSSRGGENPWNW